MSSRAFHSLSNSSKQQHLNEPFKTNQLKFLIHNGALVSASKPLFLSENRAFRYGDALFETMRYQGGRVNFIEDHVNRLVDGMSLLKMNRSELLTSELIEEGVMQIVEKNKIGLAGRIRLEVYRTDGGAYEPIRDDVEFIMQVEPLKKMNYELNKEGLKIDFYRETKKAMNELSALKSSNALVYVLGGIFKNKNYLDDCVMLNTMNRVIEGVSSNIFIVKDGVIQTPPLSDGCIAGIMRKQIMNIAESIKVDLKERSLTTDDVVSADEVFFTNVILGIRWVEKLKESRYTCDVSAGLAEGLNNKLTNEIPLDNQKIN